ncbi:hypothetical protein GGR56DRAFT_269603 [Xylariaceae sp. FL0804]|nr:hypothetical protein GGR56DRAFT_269603 [Xylariaceae sp. FL0804]
MDPITTVTSVLGIISLALQVGDCALSIKKRIDAVARAPSEIVRLEALVLRVRSVALNVEASAKASRDAELWRAEPQASSILSTLEWLLATVRHIEAMVPTDAAQSSLSRTCSHVRLAHRRGQIKELEDRLYGAVAMLTMALTCAQVVPRNIASLSAGGEKLHSNGDQPAPPGGDTSQSQQPHRSEDTPREIVGGDSITFRPISQGRTRITASRKSKTTLHKAWLGVLSISTQTNETLHNVPRGYRSGKIQTVLEKSEVYRCLIQPFFFSWTLEVQIGRAIGSELRFRWKPTHVMGQATVRKVQQTLFDRSFVGLRKLLDAGEITSDSVDQDGRSLLLLAQLYSDGTAVDYLIEQGSSVDVLNIQICTSCIPLSERTFRSLCTEADLTEYAVDSIFSDNDSTPNATWYEWYVAMSVNSTCFFPSEWYGSRLYVEARAWGRIVNTIVNCHLSPGDLESCKRELRSWEKFLLATLQHRPNLHYTDEEGCTLLGTWIQSYHPVDAEEIIRRWLKFLAPHGVDSIIYLDMELDLFKSFTRSVDWSKKSTRRRTMGLLRVGQTRGVSVNWWDDLSQPVLKEFSDLGDDAALSPLLRYSLPREPDWDRFWPFSFNAAADCQGQHRYCARCAQHTHISSRRMLRSKRKGKSRCPGSAASVETWSNMPGAWVEV